jgi:transcriptional regulator with XRE-family HTH domain
MRLKQMGERLREIRTKKNLSLREAADKIGVSHTYLNSLEKGANPRTGKPANPSAKTLLRISETYGIPVEELVATDDCAVADRKCDIEDITLSLRALSQQDRETIIYLIKRLSDR